MPMVLIQSKSLIIAECSKAATVSPTLCNCKFVSLRQSPFIPLDVPRTEKSYEVLMKSFTL